MQPPSESAPGFLWLSFTLLIDPSTPMLPREGFSTVPQPVSLQQTLLSTLRVYYLMWLELGGEIHSSDLFIFNSSFKSS